VSNARFGATLLCLAAAASSRHADPAAAPGLYARSRVVFFEAPDVPHELQVVFMFPDRARIQLSAVGAGWSARQLEYRNGDDYYFVASNSARSEELQGERRDELRLRLELRRALMLWEPGPEWTAHDDLRTRAVPDAGSLEARVDATGRPLSLRALDAGETELEAYSAIEWEERDGRRWPQAMDYAYRGTRVWREEVLERSLQPNFLDWFFVPADRRELEPQAQTLPQDVRHTDLPPAVVRRFEVDGAATWEALLARGAELVAAARRELAPQGLEVEEPVSFLLSDAGRITHCELRLAGSPPEVPAGWTAVPERPGLTVFGHGPPTDVGEQLDRLRRLAPPATRPGHPYLRVRPGAGPRGEFQIALPLVP